MRIAFKQIFIAGVAGLACAKGYTVLRQYPDQVRPVLRCSAISGATGLLLGWGVSAYRNLPTHAYTLSLGANFAIVGGAFVGIRGAVLSQLSPPPSSLAPWLPESTLTPSRVHYISSGISGTIAGALSSVVSRHSVSVVMGSGCFGLLFGIGLQFLLNMADKWRRRRAIEIHYPELVEESEAEQKWNWAKFEERFMNFWNRHSEVEQLEVEIELVKQAINEEKKAIAELDRIISEKNGIPFESLPERDTIKPPVVVKQDKLVSSNVEQRVTVNAEPR